jgi:hypothetical protein
MRTPTTADLFGAWEAALPLAPVPRALALAALVAPGDPEALAALSIGRRDSLLLALRARAFGARAQAQVACPACASELELALDVAALHALGRDTTTDTVTIAHGDVLVTVRLPTSADLLTLAGSAIAPNARRLAERCVIDARSQDCAMSPADLPAEIVSAISNRLSEIDPLGDIAVSTDCPGCGHHWDAPFDIAAFLWTELHAWACRLLRDVHALASAYGWRERDVLAISPLRRRAYLDLIGQ